MKKIDMARALRDVEYRSRLTADELASLPANPAGVASVADSALRNVTGGCGVTACNNCGGGGPNSPTSFVWSCVPPGSYCP